jgi:hypothetical protein
MSGKSKDSKWTEEEVPLQELIKEALVVSAKVPNLEHTKVEQLADSLQRRWKLVIDFYTSLLLAIYLEHDRRGEQDLDARVLQYLNQSIFSPNDLLDLCGELKEYFKKHKEFNWAHSLLELDFDRFKLISGARKGQAAKSFIKNIEIRLNDFDKASSFLRKAQILVERKVMSFPSDMYSENISVKKCSLKLCSGTEESRSKVLDLFPLILKRQDKKDKQKNCWLSLGKADWVDETVVEYLDFSDKLDSIKVPSAKIIQSVFDKKNLVSEDPVFPDSIKLEESGINIDFYNGNIFDLNGVAKDQRKNGREVALVLVPDVNLENTTAICQQFEKLSGVKIKNILGSMINPQNDADLAGKTSLSIGDVYPYEHRKRLSFSPILFVPIFDLNKSVEQQEKNICKAIDNILKFFIKKRESINTTLVVPALGGFYGDTMNRKVAGYWVRQLSSNKYKICVNNIIFALLGERSLKIYTDAFLASEGRTKLQNEIIKLEQKKTDLEMEIKDKEYKLNGIASTGGGEYSAYFYPLARLLCRIDSTDSPDAKRKILGGAVRFIYTLFTAIGLIDLYAIVKDDARLAKLTPQQRSAAASLIKCLGEMWESGAKKVTDGKLCDWANLSFKSSPLLAQMLDSVCDHHKRTLINHFLKLPVDAKDNKPSFDFPGLRNAYVHCNDYSTDCDIDVEKLNEHCDKLKDIVHAFDFIKKDFMEMVWVESKKSKRGRECIFLKWRSLTGQTNIFVPHDNRFKKEAISDDIEYDKVYLWIHRKNKLPEQLLWLDPFVRYEVCGNCRRKRVYVWVGCAEAKFEYESIACSCLHSKNIDKTSQNNDSKKEFDEDGNESFRCMYDCIKAKLGGSDG